MKRALTLLFIAAFVGGFHEWTVPAQAAMTCPQISLGQASWSQGNLGVTWGATCNGAMWKADFFVQWQQNGQWMSANCHNTTPCYKRQPNTLYYSAGSHHGGDIFFDTLNGCNVRMRVTMLLTGAGGTQFGPFASTPSVIC